MMNNTQVLCDTNIISELVKPTPDPAVVAWSQQLQVITVSVITLEEIAYGLSANPNRRVQAWLMEFFESRCLVLPITQKIALLSGQIRGELKKRGKPRTQADMLIAAYHC